MDESPSPEFLALQQAIAGRFSLVREIGRGGMGIVYLARDVALDRPVAIKLLPADLGASTELRDRFLREARTAAQLSHPNIVPIHLVEEREGLVYFVMSLIEGESLGDRVRRTGALAAGDAVRIIQELAWALAYAHGRGIVHRDVKPDNVMIERASGRAMLTDFGIARSTTAGAQTTPGMILGSLQYMAPEQADPGATIDGRADIYALGVTAFFALTGRLPFAGDRPEVLLAAHLLEPPPPLGAIIPGVPTRLAEAVDRCLAKDPANRWPNGEALAHALSEMGQNIRVMPPSIRAFTTAMGSVFMQLMLFGVGAAWATLLVPAQKGLVIKLMAAISLMPVISLLEHARAVAIAGFTARDVADAALADRRATDRYTEYVRGEVGRSHDQLKSRTGRLIIGSFGLLVLWGLIGMNLDARPGRTFGQYAVDFGFTALAGWFSIELLGHALQAGPFKDRLARVLTVSLDRQETWARRFWTSPFVRVPLAVGRMITRRKPQPAPAPNRPTEVLLASAAADLFAGLSAGERASLEAVPLALRNLESQAAGLRARRKALESSMAAVGDPGLGAGRAKALGDMERAKARIDEQLRATVEALENLRLDLLRLRAGIGSTGELNEAIEAAARLGQDIEYTLAARRELDELNTRA